MEDLAVITALNHSFGLNFVSSKEEMLFNSQGRSVLGKKCAHCLEYSRPRAQFSQYGPSGWQKTYIYIYIVERCIYCGRKKGNKLPVLLLHMRNNTLFLLSFVVAVHIGVVLHQPLGGAFDSHQRKFFNNELLERIFGLGFIHNRTTVTPF